MTLTFGGAPAIVLGIVGLFKDGRRGKSVGAIVLGALPFPLLLLVAWLMH